MSEVLSLDTELNGEPNSAGAGISPGALIRQAREASGVHIDALAAALKISVDRLEALESDRYAALPDIVFARALASSACRILSVDSHDVLALMPKSKMQSLPVSRHNINATFRHGSESHGRNYFLRQFTRPLAVAVVVILVAAGVLFFLPQKGEDPKSVDIAPERALATVEIGKSPAMPVMQQLESTIPVTPSDSAAVNATDINAEGAVNVGAAIAGDTSMAVDDVLKFQAREPTWVQVRDATKAVVFERILAKGASASVTGTLPLSVVIGRADSTDVFLRGAPFMLTSVAKENVARFEVE